MRWCAWCAETVRPGVVTPGGVVLPRDLLAKTARAATCVRAARLGAWRTAMTTKVTAWVLVAVVLALGGGCATKHWMEDLPIVDVTGTWVGSAVRPPISPF